MSESDRNRVAELLAEADGLQHGTSRVAVAEEAVRQADALGDEGLQYDARMELLSATIFGGYPDKALVAFSWLAGTCDRNPERFPESDNLLGMFLRRVDLLWAYKWIVQNTHCFSQISREQIERTLDDMEGRYRKNGYSMRPVWMNRTRIAMAMDAGPERADDSFARWQAAARDLYADCAACEQHFQVDYHLYRRDLDAANTAAEPLLAGELACAEVPHMTYVRLVVPTWLAGDSERAWTYHRRGYELCRDNRDFLEELAELVEHLLLAEDPAAAVTMLERHGSWIVDSRVGSRRLRWFVVLGALFEQLDVASVTLRLPAALGPHAGPDYDPRELAAWFDREAASLTEAFDRRNGNDLVSREAAAIRDRLSARVPPT